MFLRQRIEDLAVFEKHTVKLTRMLQGPEGQPIDVDVKDLFFRFTLDVATDFLFGQAINSLDNPREQVRTYAMMSFEPLLTRDFFESSLR